MTFDRATKEIRSDVRGSADLGYSEAKVGKRSDLTSNGVSSGSKSRYYSSLTCGHGFLP